MSKKFVVSERWLRTISHALWSLQVNNLYLSDGQEMDLHNIMNGIKYVLDNPAKYELFHILDDVKRQMNQNNTGNEG
jgi:hypothetical protein